MSTYHELADKLWEETKTDWHIKINFTLTEPTSSTIDLYSDDPRLPILRGFLGTGDLNESCYKACKKMLEIIKIMKD